MSTDVAVAAVPDAAWCSTCEAEVEPVGKGQCPDCGCWTRGNAAQMRHGLRSFRDTGWLPADLQRHVQDFKAAVVADLGGEDNLSAIELGLIENLGDLEASRLLLRAYALREGVGTKRGRDALSDHGSTVDRWNRLAKTLGLKRRAKDVDLDELIASKQQGRTEATADAT